MTEMEKMEAMKRAYAEMILNTAKEAAERVMAAELRARRSEQELFSVKEEAAHMLLRLKQMVDAKTKEAEITSMNQMKKIEVVESQLNEAEGIILDLREELNQGREQLHKLMKRQVPIKIHNEEDVEELSLTQEVICNGYELLTSSLNPGPDFSTTGRENLLPMLEQSRQTPAKQALYSEHNVYFGNNSAGLGQIEEPRFGNGCAPRTSTTETSLVEGAFSVIDKLNQSKNCTNVEGVNAAKSTSSEEKDRHEKIEAVSIVRRSVRKRKIKFWDDVITACGLKSSHQLKKPHHGSTDSSCLATQKMKRCVKNGQDLAEDGTKIENLNDVEVLKERIHIEPLPENMELVDVLVKQDELAATSEFTSASKLDCDVENGAADEASHLSDSDGDKLCKYTLNRKWRKKSVVFPEKVLDRGS